VSYSWDIPTQPNPPAPSSSGLATSSAGLRTVLAGLLDMVIDTVTLDYIRTDNGEWLESADSRSIVLCQLELELGKSYTTPGDGTEVKARLESGEPLTTSNVEADVRRAMAVLEAAGIVGAVEVSGRDEKGAQLYDESGRPAFKLSWIDLATGSPVEEVYAPLGG
jgi:hypothetical protein